MKPAIVVITTLSLSAAAISARAGDYRIGGEVGLYHDSTEGASLTALTEVIDADITVVDSIAIVGALPFVQIIGTGGNSTEARFRIGNPYAAAYYQMGTDLFRLRIGGGFAIPAAQLPNDQNALLAAITYSVALGMHGFQGPWLWSPETLPVTVPSLRLRVDLGLVEIQGGGDVALLIALNTDNDRDKVEVMLPLYAGALVHLGFLGAGADIGAAFFPTAGSGADKFQLSISPKLTATFGPVELETRLTMNIDHPAGFAFDQGGIWGFFVGAHAVF